MLRAELEAISAPAGVSVVMPGLIRTGMNPIGSIPASVVATNVLDAMRRGRTYVYKFERNRISGWPCRPVGDRSDDAAAAGRP